MTTTPWKQLAEGSTFARPSIDLAGLCPPSNEVCSRPNPRAGTIDYRLRFSYALVASHLVVQYRSAHHTAIHDLTLTQQ